MFHGMDADQKGDHPRPLTVKLFIALKPTPHTSLYGKRGTMPLVDEWAGLGGAESGCKAPGSSQNAHSPGAFSQVAFGPF
jgi:hypothetical protein